MVPWSCHYQVSVSLAFGDHHGLPLTTGVLGALVGRSVALAVGASAGRVVALGVGARVGRVVALAVGAGEGARVALGVGA